MPRAEPMQVPTVPRSDVEAADREALLRLDETARAAGVAPASVLPVAAGRALEVLSHLAGGLDGKGVCVIVGKGNKGACALHLASLAADAGAKVTLVLARKKKEYEGAAADALPTAEKAAEKVHEGYSERALESSDVVVDGLVGAGLVERPKASVSLIVKGANFSLKPILALDLPTGIHATIGPTGPVVVKAAATVMVCVAKRGALAAAAAPFVGDLYLADLGIPAGAYEAAGLKRPAAFDEAPLVRLD